MESLVTDNLSTEITRDVPRRRFPRRRHRDRRQTTHNQNTEELNDLIEPVIANEIEVVEAVSIPSININSLFELLRARSSYSSLKAMKFPLRKNFRVCIYSEISEDLCAFSNRVIILIIILLVLIALP